MKRKMLVTGAGGFIGTHVVNLLKNSTSLDVIIWDRRIMGDLLDKESRVHSLKLLKPDIVLHLAWCAAVGHDSKFNGPHNAWSLATLQFIDECLDENIWFINAGSSIEDGGHYLGNSPYARAKLQIRAYLLGKKVAHSITHLELQYVFSLEGQRPNVLQSFLVDKDYETFQLSDPGSKHDFIGAMDVATGVGKILDQGILGLVYLGSGKLRSVEHLIYAANKSLNPPPAPLKKFQYSEAVIQPNVLISAGWTPEYTNSFFE